VNGRSISEQLDPEVALRLFNVYSPADPTIPLHGGGNGLPNGTFDPFIQDPGPVRPASAMTEVLRGPEDARSPRVGITCIGRQSRMRFRSLHEPPSANTRCRIRPRDTKSTPDDLFLPLTRTPPPASDRSSPAGFERPT
jgi:hypothetical protein